MIEADRIRIERQILENGHPENVARFREVHAKDMGKPIAEVDISAYFSRLKASGVDQWRAAELAIASAEIINDEKLPISIRRRTAEAVCAAVQVLPKRLVPVGVTREIFRRK